MSKLVVGVEKIMAIIIILTILIGALIKLEMIKTMIGIGSKKLSLRLMLQYFMMIAMNLSCHGEVPLMVLKILKNTCRQQ